MPRQFIKTTFSITVLSDEPLPDDIDLEGVAHAIGDGPYIGGEFRRETQELTAKEAATALVELGSEPDFFQLDEDGNDLSGGDQDSDERGAV